jgi:glycolate oxidase iron-sulfur subunit
MAERDQSGVPDHVRATEETVGGLPNLVRDVGVAGAETARATVGADRPESGAAVLPAFDEHHPPQKDLIDDCVHCGFCLPTCPTYLLFGEEMDSPRGRIYLMRQGVEGEAMTDAMVRHFDLCLGCLACVTACPSGVQYEKLIESTRQQVERRYPRTRADRLFREMIFQIFPYPGRLRALAAGLRPYKALGIRSLLRKGRLRDLLPDRLRAMEALTPELPPKTPPLPALTPARGATRRRVGLLIGCVQRVFFPHVNAATARVLAADGCEVVAPPEQGCCGALSLHAGREEEALEFARRTIDAFEKAGVANVVVNVAGCGSAMKEYGHLLRDDPQYAERARAFATKVRDASELVQEMGPVAARHPLPVVAAYHDACHLAHGQGIRRQPREALRAIPGLELREIQEAEICCGSAGIYNLVEPEPAAQLGERKARHVLDTGAQLLVTSNPGCLLQIRASLERMGKDLPLAHPMQVVDASIRGAGVAEVVRGPS